jgi:hypothetical protein
VPDSHSGYQTGMGWLLSRRHVEIQPQRGKACEVPVSRDVKRLLVRPTDRVGSVGVCSRLSRDCECLMAEVCQESELSRDYKRLITLLCGRSDSEVKIIARLQAPNHSLCGRSASVVRIIARLQLRHGRRLPGTKGTMAMMSGITKRHGGCGENVMGWHSEQLFSGNGFKDLAD